MIPDSLGQEGKEHFAKLTMKGKKVVKSWPSIMAEAAPCWKLLVSIESCQHDCRTWARRTNLTPMKLDPSKPMKHLQPCASTGDVYPDGRSLGHGNVQFACHLLLSHVVHVALPTCAVSGMYPSGMALFLLGSPGLTMFGLSSRTVDSCQEAPLA